MLSLPLIESVLSPLPKVPSTTPIYKGTFTDTADTQSTLWDDIDVGVSHPKRIIILAFYKGSTNSATPRLYSTSTGTFFYVSLGNGSHEVQMAYTTYPVGSIVSIGLTASGSIRKAMSVYIAYPEDMRHLDTNSGTAAAANDATANNIRVAAGGFLIYAGCQHDTLSTFTTTWGGDADATDSVVEDVDAQLESAASYTMGKILITKGSDAGDVTLAASASGTKRIVAASWGPPPPGN